MAEAPTLTIDCPTCQQPLGLRKNLVGSVVQCKKCGASAQVGDDGRIKSGAKSTTPGAPSLETASSAELPALLDWLEDLFIKMIRGIFKFTIIHVPCEVYRALVRWSPTLVRIIRVTILGVIWLLLATAPLLWALFHQQMMNRFGRDGLNEPVWYYAHRLACDTLAYTYTGFAVAGSGWGVVYIKRLRRQLREKSLADREQRGVNRAPSKNQHR